MYIRKVQPDKLMNAFGYKGFGSVNRYSLELVAISVAHMTASGKFSEVYPLINVFRKQVNRSSIYGYASHYLVLKQRASENSRQLLDSARAEMLRIDNPAVLQPNRFQVAVALMYNDADKNSEEAYRMIKNAEEKLYAITQFSKAHAFNGNLYKAQQQTPSLISSTDNAFFLGSILVGLNKSHTEKKEWKKFNNNLSIYDRLYLPYINENE